MSADLPEQKVICESAALVEGGKAMRFDLTRDVFPIACFAVRFDGQAHGWVNSCPHKGTELDWVQGEFFDESGLYLICATHGATFDPESGQCISGPCPGEYLRRIPLQEKDGLVRLAGVAAP